MYGEGYPHITKQYNSDTIYLEITSDPTGEDFSPARLPFSASDQPVIDWRFQVPLPQISDAICKTRLLLILLTNWL